MAHHRVEADLAKFKFRQDPVMQVLLGRRIDDMGRVISILSKTAWLDELIAEAEAHAEADQAEDVRAGRRRSRTWSRPTWSGVV